MGTLRDHLCIFEVPPQPIQIKGIDCIYLINLDRRPERLARSLSQLFGAGIYPYRFSAIEGWDLSQEAFNDIGLRFREHMDLSFEREVFFGLAETEDPPERLDASCYGRTCVHKTTSGGSLGGSLSHLSIYQHAYNAGYETIWVLEDDFTLASDPKRLFLYLERLDTLSLGSGWDILYTDDDHCLGPLGETMIRVRPDRPPVRHLFQHTKMGSDFYRIGCRFQLHSAIFRRSGLKKILDALLENGLFRTLDVEINFVPGIQMFNLAHPMAHGRNRTYSDTEKRKQ